MINSAEPFAAAIIGLVLSGSWLAYKAGFLDFLLALTRKIQLKDKRGILLPSLLFLLSPFISFTVIRLAFDFSKTSSVGAAIFTTGTGIFTANIILERIKENQIRRKTAKILFLALNKNYDKLWQIQSKLSDGNELGNEEQIEQIKLEIGSLRSNLLFKESLDKIVLFEPKLVDSLDRYFSQIDSIFSIPEKLLESCELANKSLRHSAIKACEVDARRCKIDLSISLFLISQFYEKEELDTFKNRLNYEFRQLVETFDSGPAWLEVNLIEYLDRIRKLFDEFGISDQLDPRIKDFSIIESSRDGFIVK